MRDHGFDDEASPKTTAAARLTAQPASTAPDVVCFCHLRWDFVFQRPQHLMTRFAKHHRVFFVEEPRFADQPDHLELSRVPAGVNVVVPVLAERRRQDPAEVAAISRALVRRLLEGEHIRDYVLWYYTPMALPLSRGLAPAAVVYDCMDELTGFAGAPSGIAELEVELLGRADLVTTGGRSLYEAKRRMHHNVHAFPSSIDVAHFRRARRPAMEPPDQAAIPRPRIGFAGVIDERMDLELVSQVADGRPDWHLVLLGPVAKIDPGALPRRSNIHYLGMKSYADLPDYMAGWDVGILPFAHNAATRFISPTKTPEYLAAGLPVVSTSIPDVVTPYGDGGLARIADGADAFMAAIAGALADGRGARAEADRFLAGQSWDDTAERMRLLMVNAIAARRARSSRAADPYPTASWR